MREDKSRDLTLRVPEKLMGDRAADKRHSLASTCVFFSTLIRFSGALCFKVFQAQKEICKNLEFQFNPTFLHVL